MLRVFFQRLIGRFYTVTEVVVFLLKEIKRQLCPALLLCHYAYSSSVWYEGLVKSLKHKVQVARIRWCVLYKNNYKPNTFVTNNVLSDLKILSVNYSVRQLRL